jgi:hypothetical protein
LGEGLPTEPPQLEVQLRDKQGRITHTLYRVTDSHPAPTHPITHLVTSGPLDFLGHTLYLHADDATHLVTLSAAKGPLQPGDTLELYTFWRITAVPGRPLSLMAHLIGPDGTAAAVGDGLGYPIEQWQPGDLIIQRHTLTVPPSAVPGAYTLLSGAYWLDTLERWAFRAPPLIDEAPSPESVTQETIPLATLQIKATGISER